MSSKKINGKKIKELRAKHNLTQEELAILADVSVSIIKSIETDRTSTNHDNVMKIASVFDIDPEELYMEVPNKLKSTKVVSLMIHKGGVGKTTCAVSIGMALADLGYRVLLIDSDPQESMKRALDLPGDDERNLYTAIEQESSLVDQIVETPYENIDFIYAGKKMLTAEMMLFTKIQRELIIKRCLEPVIALNRYDFIIFDTNPTLGAVNLNVAVASDYLIIPVELSEFGLAGVDDFLSFFRQVQRINPNLQIAGLLLNKVDKRESITNEVLEVLTTAYGDKIFKTPIPIDTNVKKSQWHRIPLNLFHSNTRASKCFKAVAKELLKVVS